MFTVPELPSSIAWQLRRRRVSCYWTGMRKIMPIGLMLLTYSLTVQVAPAQWITFGAKAGGIPFGSTGFLNDSNPLLIGPSVGFQLPAGFALEVDAIYQ